MKQDLMNDYKGWNNFFTNDKLGKEIIENMKQGAVLIKDLIKLFFRQMKKTMDELWKACFKKYYKWFRLNSIRLLKYIYI